jgi:metal-sulfur cluster biosynthetic enzyme
VYCVKTASLREEDIEMPASGAFASEISELDAGIRDALQGVVDPEIGMSVVDLGLIRKIEHQPDMTDVTMILTTPFCPAAGYLIDEVRQRTQDVVGHPVKVTLGDEVWDPSMMEADEWGLGLI